MKCILRVTKTTFYLGKIRKNKEKERGEHEHVIIRNLHHSKLTIYSIVCDYYQSSASLRFPVIGLIWQTEIDVAVAFACGRRGTCVYLLTAKANLSERSRWLMVVVCRV